MTKFCAFSFALLLACTPDRSDDPIPIAVFEEFTISLSLPENNSISYDGGAKYLTYSPNNGKSVGVRGLIIYRKNPSSYLVFERNCSYRPNEACATVNIDVSGLFMVDSCCGSTFNFSDGSPSRGIAWRSLRQYKTVLKNRSLTVSSDIAN